MIELAYPHVLWAELLVVGLYFYELKLRRRPSIVVSGAPPFRGVRRKKRLSLANWLFLCGLAVLIVGLARPRFGDEKIVIRAQGIDIILALDMSGSMQAIDIPSTIRTQNELQSALQNKQIAERLTVAKQEIRRFIEKRPNDRIGLIGFADLAYSFAPPTLDHAWLIARLEQLQPGQIGEQTGIASPIGSAVRRLKDSAAPRRVLVLFTDGANTAVNALTPVQAAELAKECQVIIHTVGIGSPRAVALVEQFGAPQVVPVGDSFDEALLQKLAKITGGSYFKAADAAGMKQVMQAINKLEKTSAEQPRFVEYREYGPTLALLALALLLLGYTVETTWKLRLP